jgi:hypothetical protein
MEFIDKTNLQFTIPGTLINDAPSSDIIFTLPSPIAFEGQAVVRTFNLAGRKSTYTIAQNLVFNSIVDNALFATITIPMGVYTEVQLEALICVGTGIIKDIARPGFLIAADTTKLLSIRYLTSLDTTISNLLGLDSISTNQSGSFTTYNLGIDGKFPKSYNFSSTEFAKIEFGFNYNTPYNALDIESIPLTTSYEKFVEMNTNAPFNSLENELDTTFACNINLGGLTAFRIKLTDVDSDLLISNINPIYLTLSIEDRYFVAAP